AAYSPAADEPLAVRLSDSAFLSGETSSSQGGGGRGHRLPGGRDSPPTELCQMRLSNETGAMSADSRQSNPVALASCPAGRWAEERETTVKRMTYVTNMQHYLDLNHGVPEDIPGPALNIGLFLGSIVGWVTTHKDMPKERTNVPCRRSPGRRRCSGTVYAWFDADGSTIIWECPICHDNGVIRGWEGTLWDRRRE
ncbi:MAG: hypothetical protein AB1700_16480, partial [Bacillota bacterium]